MRYPTIACFQNQQRELIIIPLAFNSFGWGVMVNRVQKLTAGASDTEIGQAVRSAVSLCDYHLYDSSVRNPELVASGEKNAAQFHKKWHVVRITFGTDVVIVPTERDKKENIELLELQETMPSQVSDDLLGATIRDAFSKCRDVPVRR